MPSRKHLQFIHRRKSLQLARRQQRFPPVAIIQGFDTQGISGEQQAIRTGQDQREHPIELVQHIFVLILVEMEEHFRIGACTKKMPFFQTAAKIQMVVNLAVEHYGKVAAFVDHGLCAAGHIQDGQANMAQDAVADAGTPSPSGPRCLIRASIRGRPPRRPPPGLPRYRTSPASPFDCLVP